MNQEWSYEDLLDILINLHYKILDSLKVLKISIANPENSLQPIFLPNVKIIANFIKIIINSIFSKETHINQYLSNYGNVLEIYDILISLLSTDIVY